MAPAMVAIDLGALAHNISGLKKLVHPAKFCIVVKSDAYGHGAVPVARAAVEAGADYLAVAFAHEALELRQAGIEAPILMLFEPAVGSEAVVAELGEVEVTVYTERCIGALAEAALATKRTIPVHLNVNTGMNRVGVRPEDLVALAKQVVAAPGLKYAGTTTHLAVADDPDHPFTAIQLERFESSIEELAAAGIDPGLRHASNSAGFLVHGSKAHYDMVRCGIAVYGIAPNPAVPVSFPLKPVMSVKSHLTCVRRVSAGEGISYGQRYQVQKPSWIGTVSFGYAGGVRRGLSNNMSVLIGGKPYPVAGTVTMEQVMVDLGDDYFEVGEEVVMIGSQGEHEILANDWAQALNTIGYEITLGISSRVPRTYIGQPQSKAGT